MGNLTDDMTRLRGEVDALRSDRGALMQELARGARDLASTVSAMQADFAAARTAMAKKTGAEREAFVAAVISEVNSLLSAFSRDRDDMARKGRQDRGVFLSEMRRQVSDMCKETADDLMGVRRAWRGESSGKSRPVTMKKEPVVVKPIPPSVETVMKKTVAPPEIKTAKSPVTFKETVKKKEEKKTVAPPEIRTEMPPIAFKEPAKKEEEKKTVDHLRARQESLRSHPQGTAEKSSGEEDGVAPEIRTEMPPVTFKEPVKKEGEKKKVAPPEAPAVEPTGGKVPAPVRASVPLRKKTEKRRPVEKPAKKATKGNRGKK